MKWSGICGARPPATGATRHSARRSGPSRRARSPLTGRWRRQPDILYIIGTWRSYCRRAAGGGPRGAGGGGAGGAIKLKYEAGMEQRTRLEMEGVRFRGKRVDMAEHQYRFKTWEFDGLQ